MPHLRDNNGGQELPGFLQGRTQARTGPFQTRPMIAPRPMAAQPRPTAFTQAPTRIAAPKPVAKPTSQTLFEFLKGDLESERKRALGDVRSSAASRGVFYGSPLTTSEGDIETSFLRGLGQLQAGIIGNQDQLELQRLGLAGQFLGSPASFAQLSGMGGINPDVFSTIGSLFAPRQGPVAPSITPKRGNTTQSGGR